MSHETQYFVNIDSNINCCITLVSGFYSRLYFAFDMQQDSQGTYKVKYQSNSVSYFDTIFLKDTDTFKSHFHSYSLVYIYEQSKLYYPISLSRLH